jgi:N12 class adenine-specific DNA methylase
LKSIVELTLHALTTGRARPFDQDGNSEKLARQRSALTRHSETLDISLGFGLLERCLYSAVRRMPYRSKEAQPPLSSKTNRAFPARPRNDQPLLDFAFAESLPPIEFEVRPLGLKPACLQPTLFDDVSLDAAGAFDALNPLDTSLLVPRPPVGDDASEPIALPPNGAALISSGEKAKARDLITVIETLKAIEAEGRTATIEERQVLSRFAGFGPVALSIFPDPVTGEFKDQSWQALGQKLMGLLTPEEMASAKRSTFNAFYTSPIVVAAMHHALARLGVPNDGLVLEPGCGTGNFLTQAPRAMRFVGVELDSISGRIAQALHPNQEILIENFRDTKLSEKSFDAVIGNVPFADLKLEYQGQRFSLHDYFFAKAIDALIDGGILALVTSRFTLDKQNAALREFLAQRADFVGAIRLPSDAFKREGTAVIADIVFLRKRSTGQPALHVDSEWLLVTGISVDGGEVIINRYFKNRPEMILGTLTHKSALYEGGFSVRGDGDLRKVLWKSIERLPEFATRTALRAEEPPSPRFARPPPERQLSEGSFQISEDGAICQILEGEAASVVYGGKKLTANGAITGKRLGSLIRLRDLARRVLQSQNEGWPDDERDQARVELNRAYDQFISRYGPINKTTSSATGQDHVIRRMPNLVKFREDPDAMLVMSLEEYDDATGTAVKAAILQKDVVGKIPPITHVANAEDGLLVSLNQRGAIDLGLIGTLYGKTESEVISELGELIFKDPESRNWQTADAYLSGNVRAKLAAAERADSEYARNVTALRAVQPEDVLPGDIDANLGAPWLPASDIQAFAAELFRVETSSIQIAHLAKDAIWTIDAGYDVERSVAATSELGTGRANGAWLLELALNMKTPTIYDTVSVGGRDERVVNQDATLAAREKQKLIKERFRSWVFLDPDRAERLVRIYNDIFNNLRPRLFDGSHLDFPGMNQTIRLRPHQADAVWRGMSSGNTLLAHAVGAGKTYTMAATGMKMKQIGLIKKPMYVVPNHLLEQFAREFMQLYPNAKLLVAPKEELTRLRRKHLTAKIASGEWDGIIVTHSSFERIGMSLEYQEKFLVDQIAEYDQLLCDHAAHKGIHRNVIKAIEKQKAARLERLKDLLAKEKKDDGLVFEELGVDQLFIDEAHYYKNLETLTKMERVAGIQSGGSERAFDVFMKAHYLHSKRSGYGVVFATGTPISNTMVEMYTMQRFLALDGLRQRGLEHFDAWAAAFGEVIDTMEISPDGASLRPRSRFARFTNLPELQQMFRAFADVQTATMLDLPRPRLQSGKPLVVACPMSDEQRFRQAELVERYERLRSQKVDPRVDNALNITTDGRKLAIDARMLAATESDFAGSKVNALVENVVAIWKQTVRSRGTQLVFCDLGVHSTPWGYSAYGEVIDKLVAQGIPAPQIAAAGDADTDAKKQVLFEKVRNGQVRVLLGSTQKMGTGTNVQKRLVALHHLDAPWKPAEVEQREGRILRQGNQNEEVAIYRYVTEGSFDAYMWQALETKARFISQIMTGENGVRRADDIGGQELSYAEVKAIASGNPAVLTLAEADADLQRLTLLKKYHTDEQFLARRRVRTLPETVAGLTERLSQLTADQTTALTHAEDPMTIGNRVVSNVDTMKALAAALKSVPKLVGERRKVPLGIYRGLQFGLVLNPKSTEVFVEGTIVRHADLWRENQGPRAVLNALERLAGGLDAECHFATKDLAIAEAQLRDYQARLGMPFLHDVYLTELTKLRDQLHAGLSGLAAESGMGPPETLAELAERIKALQADQTINAAPQRTANHCPSAEEPVTARIRRRALARRVGDLMNPTDAAEMGVHTAESLDSPNF